jgi:N-acyl-D-aspartate/D-glutamate deacylase
MSETFEHVIRNATIVDGSGGAPFQGDIAIKGGKIAEVGKVSGKGAEETDAKGLLATPGFIDIHTHYDGQITWENTLMPSSNHGVTTVVMGNCGVGFAPCKPQDRATLVRLMEGVEDIPEVVMTTGIPWNWESFPDYMRVLAGRNADVDFAAQIPHSAVRVNVMGERGANRDPANEADLAAMSQIVMDGIKAGAIGVSTSRSIAHRAVDGQLAPSVHAAELELQALARGLGQAKAGVFQCIGNQEAHDPEQEVAMFRRLTQTSGRPLSFTLLNSHQHPDYAGRYLRALEEVNADGGPPIRGQVFPRPVGIILGLDLSFHAFRYNASYAKIAQLPLKERVAAMRDPDLRRALLSEMPEHPNNSYRYFCGVDAQLYWMDEIPEYEPSPENSIGALAAKKGVTPRELIYDLMLETEGLATFLLPAANFVGNSLDPVKDMMEHPQTLVGLGDGGAHYGMISDGSFPTSLLTMWTRDRAGGKLSVQQAVRLLTRPNAEAVGMLDRGLLAPGMKADVNLIDYDKLKLHRPAAVANLPAGGKRLIQKVEGYAMTMLSGNITYRHGEATGALPGKLVKNAAFAHA